MLAFKNRVHFLQLKKSSGYRDKPRYNEHDNENQHIIMSMIVKTSQVIMNMIGKTSNVIMCIICQFLSKIYLSKDDQHNYQFGLRKIPLFLKIVIDYLEPFYYKSRPWYSEKPELHIYLLD